jgi:hypothetical protein
MINFILHRAKASFDISKTFSISELSKGQAKELVQTGKTLNFVLTAIALYAFAEFMQRQEIHYLRENSFSYIHGHSTVD